MDPFEPAAHASPPPETMDQLYEGLDGEPDPFFAGHELYRALRGDKGDDPLADELLWEGDFMSTQREFIQKKQEDELLERLERRLGKFLCPMHAHVTSQHSAAGSCILHAQLRGSAPCSTAPHK